MRVQWDRSLVDQKIYKCRKCGDIGKGESLVNKPWYGWGDKGVIEVPNLCCQVCGSNDLVERVAEAA